MRQPSWLQRTINTYWMPTADVDAQAAHWGWGIAIVMAFPACFPNAVWFHVPIIFYGLLTAEAFSLVKEFVWDILTEPDTWADSREDWFFYQCGIANAMALYFLTWWAR
jgi:hypothetical protein